MGLIVETHQMFSFFRKKAPEIAAPTPVSDPKSTPADNPKDNASVAPAGPATANSVHEAAVPNAASTLVPAATPVAVAARMPEPLADPLATRQGWLNKLKNGLRRTGNSIATVFTGTQIDDALYEELESALLMSDAGIAATEYLLVDLKRRVKDSKTTNPAAVKALLADAFADLLLPLQKPLVVGQFKPTVMMIAGVNGAGKTTSIGKLTKHLADSGASVLLAAADTFRAAAREQLGVWADRNSVEIISQEGGDPAAVSFDAVSAGKARGRDIVMVDTAGRLPTQLHLMEEIKKIKRVIQKTGPIDSRDTAGQPQGGSAPSGGSAAHAVASVGAVPPHEVLLVIDGNTGQNALAQVKAFDEALQVTGLIITKLDGTAKGGVIAAIALWARERAGKQPALRPMGIYFIGVGEKLEDLETFDAREFAQALLQ
jgi:fused signal recognition particle receptor